jgi:hypothetical protein
MAPSRFLWWAPPAHSYHGVQPFPVVLWRGTADLDLAEINAPLAGEPDAKVED